MGSAASLSAFLQATPEDELTRCLLDVGEENRQQLMMALAESTTEDSSISDPSEFASLTGNRSCLHISLVEERGILPRQLEALVGFIRARCNDSDEISGWTDLRTSDSLRLSSINLYSVTHWIIKPLTAAARCSYVEAIAMDATSQVPSWFVSHWWGEAIVDFLKCVQTHQQVRTLPDLSAYWVCAYANNQHELGTELGSDPMQSSFLKAMHLSNGVLLILDPSATPFSRVWCCFEEGVVALAARGLVSTDYLNVDRTTLKELAARDGKEGRRPPLLLDIATVDELNPQLLTDGLTDKEQEMEKSHQFHFSCPSGWTAKSKREHAFPLEIIRLGLQVNISSSSSSLGIDKTRIINSLAGENQAALDKFPPNESHANITIVNQVLQSMFAIAGWRQALLKGVDISDDGPLPLAKGLRGDIHRRQLDLSILVDAFKEQYQVDTISSAFAPLTSLVDLHLDLKNCHQFTNVALLSQSLMSLNCLQKLFLNLCNCDQLASITGLGAGLSSNLRELDLSLQFCKSLQNDSMDDLGLGLSRLTNLKHLKLCVDCCDEITSLDGLGVGFGQLSKLQKLKLDISRLGLIEAIEGLAEGLKGLKSLEDIWFQSAFNRSLTDVSHLGLSVASWSKLRTLDLSFQYCNKIKSLQDLGKSLQNLTNLIELHLNFGDCFDLDSVHELAVSMPHLTQLEGFSIQLNRCTKLTVADVSDLVGSTTSLPKLVSCGFALFGCTQLGNDLVYFFEMEKRPKLLALLSEAGKKL